MASVRILTIDDEDRRTVGARLRALRTAHGLSQTDVADHIGGKQASVSEWESGRKVPSRAAQLELARLYGMDRHSLFNEVL